MPDRVTAWEILRGSAAALRPPRRVRVSEGAADALVIAQPGGYSGPWSPTEAPYMVEPMDMLASRRHEAVCFVGPARSGKTMGLLDGWVSYAATCDPGDMLIVQMTQDKARDYSKTRIDRGIRNSPKLKALMSLRGHDDNTHDKMFRHGMWLKIGWPSASQLSGSDYRYVGLTDYDRMPDDIDGEGDAFSLARKRTQTFLSRGMCMVESSPGRPIMDPRWRPSSLHEAPPCGGILGIYNRSDLRRWYWPCPHCGEFFEASPGLSRFATLPAESELRELVRTADLEQLATEHAQLVCPHCAALIGPEHKPAMNAAGRWVPGGQSIQSDGSLLGEPIHSSIAGYWLGGVAAAYQSWQSLLLRYLQALRDYVLTGAELALQATINTDQGMPYLPRALAEERAAGGPADRAEPFPRYLVPAPARFLTAAVDVQAGRNARFVVQVHAHATGHEQWLIDRYNISESRRPGPDGQPLAIDPAAYPEDWDLLTEKILQATYRTSAPGTEWRIKIVLVDSGGADGVTDNAYAWYRRLKREGLQQRVRLIKGASTRNAPRFKESYPDASGRKDRKAASRGDIPLWLLNTEQLKDAVWAGLQREQPGPGYYHFPDWLGSWFYEELSAEIRTAAGWKKLRARNEAVDLCAYNRAAALMLGVDKLRWDSPPAWALPGAENSEAVSSNDRRQLQAERPTAATRRVVTGRRFG